MTFLALIGASVAAGHPPLWGGMSAATPRLFVLTNGLRLLSGVLAGFIISLWWPSVWASIRRRASEAEEHKAGWWPLAIAVLIFVARWFLPTLSVVAQARMVVVGQSAMTLALMFAIYVHGKNRGGLQLRRALLVFLAMLGLCIGASVFIR